jgi:hypothetical protein
VWYRPDEADLNGGAEPPMQVVFDADGPQPLAAQIVAVYGPRMVSVVLYDADGRHYARTSVMLMQGDAEDPPMSGRYVEWMPYQQGQAKRHEIGNTAGNMISTTAAASISHGEYQTEIAIQVAGATAPRIKPEDVLAAIDSETYTITPSGRTTICELTLTNGFTVRGESSVVSMENFDEAIGRTEARKKAIDKVWELEGYRLMQKLYEQRTMPGDSVRDERARIDRIARVCHEVNRAYCAALGDNSQPAWDDAPSWQRESVRMGVDLHLMGDFGPEASHLSWMNEKYNTGWVYGEVKDPEKKEHPCLVPFDQLPKEQQAKDYIFRAVVHALR